MARVLTVVIAALVLAAGAGGAGTIWPAFAPFADMSGYPAPDLAAIRSGAGVRAVTLGFVTARSGSSASRRGAACPRIPRRGRRRTGSRR